MYHKSKCQFAPCEDYRKQPDVFYLPRDVVTVFQGRLGINTYAAMSSISPEGMRIFMPQEIVISIEKYLTGQ